MAAYASRMATSHRLGITGGTLYDHGDGTVSYRAPGKFLDSFRVRIADVVGFTETRGGKKSLQNTLHIVGLGGEIASCDVNVGTTQRIEEWFRAHTDFGKNNQRPSTSVPGTSSVADELTKLAQLRDAGVLTDQEFAAQKAKLLG
jgi:hypothetical protein